VRTQKLVIGHADASPADLLIYTRSVGAVAFFHGIPPMWQERAREEGWTLPHVLVEEIPDEPSSPS
jgi:hypothetical protein